MKFNFLSFKILEENTINLLSEVRALHKKTQKEIYNDIRQGQVDLLDSLHNNLRKLQALPYDGNLTADYSKQIDENTKQLQELSAASELTEEQKALQKKLQRLNKSLNKLITEILLEDVENVELIKARERVMDNQYRAEIVTGAYLSIKEEIEREYSGRISKFLSYDPNNEALYAGIDKAIGVASCDLFLMASNEDSKFKHSNKNHLYLYKNEKGFFYHLENSDDMYYVTGEAAVELLQKANFDQTAEKPVKCQDEMICDAVLALTNKAGHTEHNPLDKLSRQKAISAFRQYAAMNGFKLDKVDDIKDEDIKASIKHKNSNVKTIEKIEKPRYEDSVNTTLLLASKQMIADANDKYTPANTKKILNNLISQYTKNEDLFRYNKDDNFRLNYLMMNGYQLGFMSDDAPKLGEIHVRSTEDGLEYKVGVKENIVNSTPYHKVYHYLRRDNELGDVIAEVTADSLLDELDLEKNAIYLMSWEDLPSDFPRDFTRLDQLSKFIPDITQVASEQGQALELTRLIQDIEDVDMSSLNHVEQNEKTSPGKVREAKPEEAMHYQMSEKQYTFKKIPDKEPVKVLSGWKGEYSVEEKEKAKANWKGVQKNTNLSSCSIALFNTSKAELDTVKLKKAATKVSGTPAPDVDMDKYREDRRNMGLKK